MDVNDVAVVNVIVAKEATLRVGNGGAVLSVDAEDIVDTFHSGWRSGE